MSARTSLSAAALGVAMTILGAGATSASAALPRLRLPEIKPRIVIPELPAPPRVSPDVFEPAERYGISEPTVIDALDSAASGIDEDFEATASRVAANEDAKLRIKECAAEGLKGAGSNYRDDVQAAIDAYETSVPPPDFDELSSAIGECMKTYFSDAPEEIFDVAVELSNEAYERSQEASDAAPYAAVLAEWMTVSGDEVTTPEPVDETSPPPPVEEPVNEPDPDPPAPDDGFPWLPVLGVVVVLAIAGGLYAARGTPGR